MSSNLDVARKIEWEGGVADLIEWGGRAYAEKIKDKTVRAAYLACCDAHEAFTKAERALLALLPANTF
jgi:hypothetical protein